MNMRTRSILPLLLAFNSLWIGGCFRDLAAKKLQYFESGKAYFQKGKYPEAIIQFQNAIQIDKNFAAAHYQLAQCFLQQGLWGNAYRELAVATELEPTDLQAQLDLANLLFGSKQFQDARARAESVLKGAPSEVAAQILLANSDAELGDMQAALREAQS